jgi:hypothetical protein
VLADGGPGSRYAYIRLTDQMLVNHFRDRGLLSPPSERKLPPEGSFKNAFQMARRQKVKRSNQLKNKGT